MASRFLENMCAPRLRHTYVEGLNSDREAIGYCEKGHRPSPLQRCSRTQTHAVYQEADRFQQDVLYPLMLISAIYAKTSLTLELR